MVENNPEILSLVSKEKFRRKIVVATKILAFIFIVAIIWVGWINYSYARDINKLMAEHGSLGYCYMCGKEAFKKCECQYASFYGEQINWTARSEMLSIYNLETCSNKDLGNTKREDISNLSLN